MLGSGGLAVARRIQEYYAANPLMVSSPFGGVDGVNEELLEAVFAALDIDVADRAVLDVGCGRGHVGGFVERRGGRYVGMDLLVSRRGFTMVLADGADLPFRDGAFDAVFCVDAFEHFPDPVQAAREFRRVLAPGGFVFLSAPNYSNVAGFVKKAAETFGRYEKNTWAPFRHWQPQELEHALTGRKVRRIFHGAGFTNLRRIAHGGEIDLGLFPWTAHARMPEAITFRLQRLFGRIGPAVARIWPGASLHGFWKIG